jgi:hypothetical protein
MKAALSCVRQSFGVTKRKAGPREKNCQQRWAAGSGVLSQTLDLDRTILVLATLGAKPTQNFIYAFFESKLLL